MAEDWSRAEVEATVADYLEMLARELAGVPYNKAAHGRALAAKLGRRSKGSIEFKHANISAALIHLGHPYIVGYQPRFNYQQLVLEVAEEQLSRSPKLLALAAQSADQEIMAPEVEDILAVRTEPPRAVPESSAVHETGPKRNAFRVDYLEREARNRSLGDAGENFIIQYERARLIDAGKDALADRIEHTAKESGDAAGYDVLSFETNGRERLIEVKTTKYGAETPFFLTRNELAVSTERAEHYHLYRLFLFQQAPRLFMLAGRVDSTCRLSPATYSAVPF